MNDTENIHDFDFSLICEYFASLDRQGPGTTAATARALSFLPALTADQRIADVGCGTGASTMVLAQHTPAQIVAVDLFGDFLDKLRNRADTQGYGQRITTIQADMGDLPFEPESLDVIWAEGSIYNIGFKHGIELWRPLLRSGGYLVVSESTWRTPERPAEIEQFWTEAYPEIGLVSRKVSELEQAGYAVEATFALPSQGWEQFYAPAAAAQEQFLARHGGDPTAEGLVANQRHEAALYRRYHNYYDYTFFIARKID